MLGLFGPRTGGATSQSYSENKELRSRDRFESHAIAESFNPPRELVDEMCSPMVVNVIGPQLSLAFVAGEPMEGTDDERVGHRQDGPFLPATGSQALIQGGSGSPLRAGRRRGPLGQAGAQGLGALAGLPGASLAGAVIVAGGDATPSRQAGGRATAPQVDAPLRYQQLSSPRVDAGNRV